MSNRVHGWAVAKAASLYVLGNFTQRGVLFASLPIYARILDVDGFACWSLFLGLCAALSIAFDLAWSRAVPRLYYEYVGDAAGGDAYLIVSFVQRVCLLCVSILIFAVLAPTFVPIISAGKLSARAFAAPLLVTCASDAMILYVCAAYRARQRPFAFVSLKVCQICFQLGGSFIAVAILAVTPDAAARGFASGSLVMAIVATIVFMSWARSAQRLWLPFVATFRTNANFSLPLVFHDYASWLRNAADPFIIVQFLPLYSVSVYHVGYQFGLVIGLVLYSIELALGPFYFEMMKTDPEFERKYLQITQSVVVLTFIIAVTLALFAQEFVEILFPPELREAARIAPLIVPGYFFLGLYTVYIKPFILLARTRIVPVITIIPTILGIAASIVLVQTLGVVGPAIATIASLASLACVSIAAAQKVLPFPYPFRQHALLASVALIVGVTSSLFWQSVHPGVLPVKVIVWLALLVGSYRLLPENGKALVRAVANRGATT